MTRGLHLLATVALISYYEPYYEAELRFVLVDVALGSRARTQQGPEAGRASGDAHSDCGGY